jgi:membrane associated rhomboid family serine protease
MHSSPFCLNHHRPPHHLKINSTHKNTATRTSATRRNNCFQYDPLHASMAFVTSGLVITKLMVNNNDNNNDQLRLPSSHQIQNLEVVQNFFTSDSSNIEEWKDFFTSSWKSIRRNVSRELEDDNRKALAGLIAMNTFIFCLWRMAMRHRNSKVEAFMWRHFACSYDTVVYGKRLHTLLTSSFSHLTFPHFGINMFMLWEFGTHVLAPSSNNTNANVWYTKSKLVEAMRNAFSSSTNGSHHKLLSLDKFMTLYMTSALSSSMLSVAVAGLKGTGAGR